MKKPTIIPWTGSKASQAAWFRERVPLEITGRWIEPFAGVGALWFALGARAAGGGLLNDNCPELVTMYHMLQTEPDAVLGCYDLMCATHAGHYGGERYFYDVRGQMHTPTARGAARFLFLVTHANRGMWRTNSRGEPNAPYGHNQMNGRTSDEIREFLPALARTEIRFGDWRNVLPDVRQDDYVYADPPYAQSAHTRYSAAGYVSPYELMRALSEKCGRFGMSYAYEPEVAHAARELGLNHEIVDLRGRFKASTRRQELFIWR